MPYISAAIQFRTNTSPRFSCWRLFALWTLPAQKGNRRKLACLSDVAGGRNATHEMFSPENIIKIILNWFKHKCANLGLGLTCFVRNEKMVYKGWQNFRNFSLSSFINTADCSMEWAIVTPASRQQMPILRLSQSKSTNFTPQIRQQAFISAHFWPLIVFPSSAMEHRKSAGLKAMGNATRTRKKQLQFW